MSDTTYVEIEFTVRARVRVPEGQTPQDVIDNSDMWSTGVVNELQTDLEGGDVKRFFEKVSAYADEIETDPQEFYLGQPS